MKKKLSILPLLFFLILHLNIEADSLNVKEKYKFAVDSTYKLPLSGWSFHFQENEHLFNEPLSEINKSSKEEASQRFLRMMHSNYLKNKNTQEMLDRAYLVSKYVPQIISYVKNEMSISSTVQHISIYGSFLYNMDNPDDVDILIIVDSPYPIFQQREIDSKLITGKENLFPNFSLEVQDYNSYQVAMSHSENPHLPRSERLALGQLAVGSTWYFTIYGFDLRYDNLKELRKNTRLNYLKHAIGALKAAGARLYKSIYSHLPPESERVRLRKVVSRILITDFLITHIDHSIKPSPEIFDELHEKIKVTKKGKNKEWKKLEERIQNLYFQKLKELLSIADNLGKLDEISFSEK